MNTGALNQTVASYLEKARDDLSLNTILARELINGQCSAKLVSDQIIDVDQELRNGIPAVGHIFMQDNDFWDMQRAEWKSAYPELCTDTHTILITEILDSKVLNDMTIRLSKRKLIVEILG